VTARLQTRGCITCRPMGRGQAVSQDSSSCQTRKSDPVGTGGMASRIQASVEARKVSSQMCRGRLYGSSSRSGSVRRGGQGGRYGQPNITTPPAAILLQSD